MSPPRLALVRAGLLALAVAAWLMLFWLLARTGSWLGFAAVGPALAALALALDPASRALLGASPAGLAAGLATGLLMVLATHALFLPLAAHLPRAGAAATRLFALLEAGGPAPGRRAMLLVVIAASEEVVFRGALLSGRRPVARVVLLAAIYALASVTLHSLLLLMVSFGCALVWGGLRLATGSLAPAIIAHVLWDLGVLVVWPLR